MPKPKVAAFGAVSLNDPSAGPINRPAFDAAVDPEKQICRNVTVGSRRTSLRMEPYIWDSLQEVCQREGMSVSAICTAVDQRRGDSNLTAALRVFLLRYFRIAAELSAGVPPPPGLPTAPVFEQAIHSDSEARQKPFQKLP